jgi:hypothetical protein
MASMHRQQFWLGPAGAGIPVTLWADTTVNRPGVSGDSDRWEGWGHVGEFVEAVSA